MPANTAQFIPVLVDAALSGEDERRAFAREHLWPHLGAVHRAITTAAALRDPHLPARALYLGARDAISEWSLRKIGSVELARRLGEAQTRAREALERATGRPGMWAMQEAVRRMSRAFRKRVKGVRLPPVARQHPPADEVAPTGGVGVTPAYLTRLKTLTVTYAPTKSGPYTYFFVSRRGPNGTTLRKAVKEREANRERARFGLSVARALRDYTRGARWTKRGVRWPVVVDVANPDTPLFR